MRYPGQTTAGKAADHADFEGLQLLLAPLHAAAADADTGCPIDGIALRHHAMRKPGHLCRELGGRRGMWLIAFIGNELLTNL